MQDQNIPGTAPQSDLKPSSASGSAPVADQARHSAGEPPAPDEYGPANDAEIVVTDGEGDAGQSSDIPRHDASLEKETELMRAAALPYPLVAFGSSAGGIQAFGAVLDALSPETGMTFVLVSHLAADQKSYLTEIMERHTHMPVLPIENGQRPLPNHVYILLPNNTVQMRGGLFHVEERGRTTGRGTTIDLFFRSVAAEQKTLAIGVILSGADSDGAQGLKTIKGEGGVAIVQTPESAQQPGMPRSSIAADHVDLVLPPGEIAAELARLALQFGEPALRTLDKGEVPEGEEQAYQRILQLIRGNTGLELRNYKPQTIRRRLARRMLLVRRDKLSDYYRFVQSNPAEMRALQEDVLIGVTRFFRDAELWEALRTSVLPTLFAHRKPENPVRVWCAGCSTGEEAYSLAIALLEYITEAALDIPIQIFGTDASERSIEIARAGIYPHSLVSEISAERLRRFFVSTDRGFQIAKRVRDTCIFARQNLSNDPPFSHIDLLSCRNVLIYFEQTLQRKVLSTFHYALEAGGYLLLGQSEGLREHADLFTAIDRKSKIYSKLGTSDAGMTISSLDFKAPEIATRPAGTTSSAVPAWPELELQRAADRLSLARYGPAGLVIDDKLNVLQTRGQIAAYLQPLPGSVSWNLNRVLRPAILREVQPLLEKAFRDVTPVSASFPLLDEPAPEQRVHVDVLPINSTGTWERCFLVLFQMVDKTQPEPLDLLPPFDSKVPEAGDLSGQQRLVAQLRQDLTATRYHLQSLVEERDARNQELVSANEEIQSANEELQSTNEELETTKEELQSANEELQTVNEELQQRNLALAQTGNDLSNLLNSVNIPLLMLTSDLKIRQFTPPMQRLLNVRPTDIGRAIREIRLQLSVDDIEPILVEVLETLGTRDLEVQDRQGKWFLLRVRPYRTAEDKIEGLVMVLLDIDQLRSSQQRLLEARDFAGSVIESVSMPLVALNQDCTIRTANTAFRTLSQMSGRDLTGRSLPDLLQQLWGIADLSLKLAGLLVPGSGPLEFEHLSSTSDRRTLAVKAQLVQSDGTRVFLLTLEDITRRREVEQTLARQRETLETDIEHAARKLSRTQEELRRLTAHLFSAQEEERQTVARELHDDIAQRLSALELTLARASESSEEAALADARRQLQELTASVRDLSHQLHPPLLDDRGLASALQALVDEFGRREGMPATCVSRQLPEIKPQPAVTALYRITQEALRNVSRHAGKTHVKVFLEAIGDRLHLEVRDLGTGFDPETELDGSRDGLGLISMKERARLAHGTLSVHSAPGEGTTVTAEIPFERGEEPQAESV